MTQRTADSAGQGSLSSSASLSHHLADGDSREDQNGGEPPAKRVKIDQVKSADPEDMPREKVAGVALVKRE